jgi:general secretion pathway protein D
LATTLVGVLAGCATAVIDEAEQLSRSGRYEEAYARLDTALQGDSTDAALRTAHSRQRDRVVVQALSRADMALAAGRLDEARHLLDRVQTLAPAHPRLASLPGQIEEARRGQQRVAAQRQAAAAAATAPPPRLPPALPAALAAAWQKPVALEFREATLRQVFESLARSTGVNFVFDKDVRGDAKVTVFLRGVTLDEALRVILATQQLDRKLLNDSTVLVFPNTAAKQREHQELVTRTLYLANADAKQVLTLVRTMAKTRDLHADERLNLLVVRDTPEVVRQVERLVATLDLPEPEVMLAVEVMEVASNRLDELGLSWPTSVQYGLPGVSGAVELGARANFRASVANPALAATLRGDAGSTNLLANPTIRARNREKAKVQIGEKLPVFTTTSTANVGVSTSVSYLDVGLKLDVEPTVQLDGDVTIKVALEVSNLLREVSGPAGSLAYQVGTRSTTTALRLKDGETQVLAGLINDEDRQRAVGLPGLSRAPLLGKLFGVQSDTRNKTEVVMLITPHIVRRLQPVATADATIASGTDSQPGAASLRLQPGARAGVAASHGRLAAAPPRSAEADAAGNTAAAADASPPSVLMSTSGEARVSETLAVTLSNRSAAQASGELVFDAAALQLASGGGDGAGGRDGAGGGAGSGRAPFQLAPRGQAVLVLRVLPAAAGRSWPLQVLGLSGTDANGQAIDLRLEGEATLQVPANDAPQPGVRR